MFPVQSVEDDSSLPLSPHFIQTVRKPSHTERQVLRRVVSWGGERNQPHYCPLSQATWLLPHLPQSPFSYPVWLKSRVSYVPLSHRLVYILTEHVSLRYRTSTSESLRMDALHCWGQRVFFWVSNQLNAFFCSLPFPLLKPNRMDPQEIR